MKSQYNIEELASKLMENARNKKDMIVDTSYMTAIANGDVKLHIEDKKLGIDDTYTMNNTCLNQIATKVGISKKYLDKMRDGHNALLQDNFNYWMHKTPKQQMIRTQGTTARAFLSDKYKRVDNEEIANTVLPILLDKGYEIMSSAITDSKMYIKARLPKLEREVTKGDVVQAGVTISNSEVGAGSVNVSPFIYRLVCLNGMTINDARLNSRHLTSSQATIDGVWTVLSDEAKELDNRALLAKVKDVVLSTTDEVRFNQNVAKMTDATEIKIKSPKKVIEVLENRFDLSKVEGENILENLVNRNDTQKFANLWSVVNSITALGNTMDDYDRGTKMQEIGGRLLNEPQLIAA
jgi:hypothetical protein